MSTKCIKLMIYFCLLGLLINVCQAMNNANAQDNSNLNATPSFNGAILISNNSPIINTQQNSTGILQISNAGNYSATFTGVTYPDSVTATTGSNACSTSLSAHSSCNLYFTVPVYSGSGIITLNYTGGTASALAQVITWYNGAGAGEVVQISADPSSITIINNEAASSVVTITNLGPYPLDNLISSVAVASGNANVSISNDNCSSSSLAVNASCSITISANDLTEENSQLLALTIQGTYNNGINTNYQRILAINYSSQVLTQHNGE